MFKRLWTRPVCASLAGACLLFILTGCSGELNPLSPREVQLNITDAGRADTADAGVDAGVFVAGSDVGILDAGADAGECFETSDFTRCKLFTNPDRSYDICVAGTCLSPGCGDTSCNEPGPHFALPDTDQRKCYDNATEIPCTAFPCNDDGTPDFCGQDAQYGWDAVHQQTERFSRTESVVNEPVALDNVTGLVWQGCATGLSGSECENGAPLMQYWPDALTYCDRISWGGHTDWRLPDRYELQSIGDYSVAPSGVDAKTFLGPLLHWSWSSTTYAGGALSALFLDNAGGVDNHLKGTEIGFRCVRGGEAAAARFAWTEAVAGQPVIGDGVTSLVWQGCPAGLSGGACWGGSVMMFNWQAALKYCEGLAWGNRTDWRLPNVTELGSIADTRRVNPSIDETTFPATPSDYFWTSTSYINTGQAHSTWLINFGDGGLAKDVSGKATSAYPVRCVRTGP
jgi:hypothetical protein